MNYNFCYLKKNKQIALTKKNEISFLKFKFTINKKRKSNLWARIEYF